MEVLLSAGSDVTYWSFSSFISGHSKKFHGAWASAWENVARHYLINEREKLNWKAIWFRKQWRCHQAAEKCRAYSHLLLTSIPSNPITSGQLWVCWLTLEIDMRLHVSQVTICDLILLQINIYITWANEHNVFDFHNIFFRGLWRHFTVVDCLLYL